MVYFYMHFSLSYFFFRLFCLLKSRKFALHWMTFWGPIAIHLTLAQSAFISHHHEHVISFRLHLNSSDISKTPPTQINGICVCRIYDVLIWYITQENIILFAIVKTRQIFQRKSLIINCTFKRVELATRINPLGKFQNNCRQTDIVIFKADSELMFILLFNIVILFGRNWRHLRKNKERLIQVKWIPFYPIHWFQLHQTSNIFQEISYCLSSWLTF